MPSFTTIGTKNIGILKSDEEIFVYRVYRQYFDRKHQEMSL